jgi:GxxExxY protein
MTYELRQRELAVEANVALPVIYKGVRLDAGYRLDLVVESTSIVELKAVATLLPVHEAQLLSYLRLSGRRLGLLMNFHEPRLIDGLKRIVNGLPRDEE